MRAQVSSSGSRYSYDEVVARVVQYLRPSLDVPVAGARVFADEGSRLRACARIPTDVDPASGIYVGGRCRSSPNPSLDELLAVVDETAALSG